MLPCICITHETAISMFHRSDFNMNLVDKGKFHFPMMLSTPIFNAYGFALPLTFWR
jgi:hypothetical protein